MRSFVRSRAAAACAVVLASVLLTDVASAATFNACANNTTGKVKKITLTGVPSCNLTKETVVSWNDDASPLAGFARVTNDGFNLIATVDSFGGSMTTNVTGTSLGTGLVVVSFFGQYPDAITGNDVTILSTAQSNNFDVTNAFVSGATQNQIDVYVYDWQSDTQTMFDNTAFVAILVAD